MKKYVAEYSKRGQYDNSICTANTIEELMQILIDRGYTFEFNQKEKIMNWSKTNQKKYYGANLTIRNGDAEMTEYTSY